MTARRVTLTPDDHIAGSPSAPVLLVEYGDFQCPYCGEAAPQVERLQERLGDRMAFVFRHFPLTQVHPEAEQAAEAAEAAGAQGRFWEMHHLLYANQQDLSIEALRGHARELNLDMDAFERDIHSHRYHERIRHDFLTGVRSGVNGTPSFFINGHRHDGAFSTESLLADIEGKPAHAP